MPRGGGGGHGQLAGSDGNGGSGRVIVKQPLVPATPATQTAPGIWKLKTVYELRVQGDWLGD